MSLNYPLANSLEFVNGLDKRPFKSRCSPFDFDGDAFASLGRLAVFVKCCCCCFAWDDIKWLLRSLRERPCCWWWCILLSFLFMFIRLVFMLLLAWGRWWWLWEDGGGGTKPPFSMEPVERSLVWSDLRLEPCWGVCDAVVDSSSRSRNLSLNISKSSLWTREEPVLTLAAMLSLLLTLMSLSTELEEEAALCREKNVKLVYVDRKILEFNLSLSVWTYF